VLWPSKAASLLLLQWGERKPQRFKLIKKFWCPDRVQFEHHDTAERQRSTVIVIIPPFGIQPVFASIQ
jgi:hypothetical protein